MHESICADFAGDYVPYRPVYVETALAFKGKPIGGEIISKWKCKQEGSVSTGCDNAVRKKREFGDVIELPKECCYMWDGPPTKECCDKPTPDGRCCDKPFDAYLCPDPFNGNRLVEVRQNPNGGYTPSPDTRGTGC